MSKKEDLYKTIHHQTGIDVRNYVEPASIKKKKERLYLNSF